MDMMDYLYNDEIIMRNHDAQLIRESELRGESRGISIGEARGRTIAEQEFAVERAALLSEIARLKGLSAVQ